MSDESGGCGSDRSVPQRRDTLISDSLAEEAQPSDSTLSLLGRLERVDRGESHPEARRRGGGSDRLDQHGEMDRLEERDDTGVSLAKMK